MGGGNNFFLSFDILEILDILDDLAWVVDLGDLD